MTQKVAGVLQDNLSDLANHEDKWPIFNFYLYQQPKKEFLHLFKKLTKGKRVVIDVADDGNCGYYACMLGLTKLGIETHDFYSGDHIEDVINFRKTIHDFMRENQRTVKKRF